MLAVGKTILLLGDSLSAGYGLEKVTDGWPALLQARLSEKHLGYQLVNESISGETTSNGLFKLPSMLEKYHPDIVIIAYGGNDGLRGLDLNAMKSNIAQMIVLIEKNQAKVLLAGVRLPPNYGSKYTQGFERVYTSLSKEYHIALVANMLRNVDEYPDLMQADGLHPNKKGQPLIFENIWLKLLPLLK
ncbi:MAG: tesA [Gammaproteobacteria bacterium]|jgi:acyl-CoA thioesterase-1|nr:tesA [Gammaproteobacteria bacterium]